MSGSSILLCDKSKQLKLTQSTKCCKSDAFSKLLCEIINELNKGQQLKFSNLVDHVLDLDKQLLLHLLMIENKNFLF